MSELRFNHSLGFKARRFVNWFPMGLTYALLYMGRYNLTVAKTSLGDLMTKEDFGIIFGAGTVTYALSFLINGPLIDRIGGRKGILFASAGSALANLSMGLYLLYVIGSGDPSNAPLRLVFSLLYSVNMYFQSYGAVSIVKVNAHWFHVRERGGFSGIFGTMISSGIFLAFTVNGWILDLAAGIRPDEHMEWLVFVAPAALLAMFFIIEFFLLRDSPSRAGHADFDTGDASSGDDSSEPYKVLDLFKRILTNPIIMTVAIIELCTGVLRNGIMHWFPIYAREVWVLPNEHMLVNGNWEHWWIIAVCFGVAIVSGVLAAIRKGKGRAVLIILGALAFLAPFVQAGWGGLLFVAGVIGGNVAGWVSDLFFQSRRAPAAGGLYAVLTICCIAMVFLMARPGNEVQWASDDSGLAAGDRIVELAGEKIEGWEDVRAAAVCWPARCLDSVWDADACMCTTSDVGEQEAKMKASNGTIPAVILRDGAEIYVDLPDPKTNQKAGDRRRIAARPSLPISPFWMGGIVFLLSLCVIGTHGLLSGTATMDFGGRRGAATAVGIIDGFVYLGTAIQSISLGFITARNWAYWPLFLIPFSVIGFVLLTRIWNAKPTAHGGGH